MRGSPFMLEKCQLNTQVWKNVFLSILSSKNGILWKKNSSARNSNTSGFSPDSFETAEELLHVLQFHHIKTAGTHKGWNEIKALICMDSSRRFLSESGIFLNFKYTAAKTTRATSTVCYCFIWICAKMSAALPIITSVNIKNSEKGIKYTLILV